MYITCKFPSYPMYSLNTKQQNNFTALLGCCKTLVWSVPISKSISLFYFPFIQDIKIWHSSSKSAFLFEDFICKEHD